MATSATKPTLDSRQVLAFAALARRGSFTLAAMDLQLTQSAVSHAMKALEADVGCRLIDRVGRRVQLTQAGEEFLRHADNILREMQSARTAMDGFGKRGSTRLRIGASATACEHILPTVVRQFRQLHDHCRITIEPGDLDHQFDLLRSSQVDLALILEPPAAAADDLVFVPLFVDELRFLVAPVHPWADLTQVPREAVGGETIILYNKRSYTFRLVSDYFRREKVLLTHVIELGSMDAIKQLAKLSLGAGVLAPWVAQRDLQAGALVSLPLGDRPLARRWGIAYWKGRRLAMAEESFIALCEAVAETLGLTLPRSAA